MNDKEKKIYLLLIQYWRAQEAKLEKDTKEMVEAFNRNIQKQEEEQRKLEMMREHPEWFEVTSPKQYGMNLKKNKKRK